MIALLAALAFAQEEGGPTVEVHGDVKAFVVGVVPYEHSLLGGQALVQGIGDGRLKLSAAWGRWAAEVHHEITLLERGATGLPGASTGVGLTAPEAVDLTWQVDQDDLVLRGRTDRLWVRGRFGAVDVTLGRQPVSFGAGTVFTPLDLVAPFHPATIDQEYKPGVDAARVDAFFGTSGQITGVVAYAGDWELDGMVGALYAQGTVGVTDVGGFLGMVHGEPVFGVSLSSSVGPVGLYGDATWTLPEDDDPFVRAVAGVLWMPTGTTTFSGELYAQTFGADDPSEYLLIAQSARFARGEVWQLGRYYAAVAVGQEITPLVRVNAAVITNLLDPSALLAPGVTWSVAENAELSAGAWIGLGQRPGELRFLTEDPLLDPDAFLRSLGVRSEFGLYPAALFLRLATYF